MATYTVFKKQISNWQNYIAVCLLLIVSILVSVFRIDSTGVSIVSYEGVGWFFFIAKVILPPIIGLLILSTMRKQGVKEGFEDDKVKLAKEQWEQVVIKTKDFKPRSLSQFMKSQMRNDILIKAVIFLLTSFLAISMTVQTDLAGVIGLVFNLGMFLSTGFVAKGQAEEFVKTELILWYSYDIERIQNEQQSTKELVRDLPTMVNNVMAYVEQYERDLLTQDINTATLNLLDNIIKEGEVNDNSDLDTNVNGNGCGVSIDNLSSL